MRVLAGVGPSFLLWAALYRSIAGGWVMVVPSLTSNHPGGCLPLAVLHCLDVALTAALLCTFNWLYVTSLCAAGAVQSARVEQCLMPQELCNFTRPVTNVTKCRSGRTASHSVACNQRSGAIMDVMAALAVRVQLIESWVPRE